MTESDTQSTLDASSSDAASRFADVLKQVGQQLAAAGIAVTEEQVLKWFTVATALRAALCFAAGKPIRSIDELPVSSGYQPLFIENGWNPVVARAGAAILVRHGRRVATEAKRVRPACDAIRFLAKPGRREGAILRRAELLLTISRETSIVATVFESAGLNEHEFLALLKACIEKRRVDLSRISAIAAQLTPHLRLARGPKVSAASAAQEFILENSPELAGLRSHPHPRSRGRVHVDALTSATQREFRNHDFDSRPVRRRLKRRTR